MSQFVSEHVPEWLPLLAGGALLVWIAARLYRRFRPFRQRRSLHSDRRKTPRTSDRRQIDEP
ncbi:MAG: hypothetical protein QM739_17580 [Propionivibrio sp.]